MQSFNWYSLSTTLSITGIHWSSAFNGCHNGKCGKPVCLALSSAFRDITHRKGRRILNTSISSIIAKANAIYMLFPIISKVTLDTYPTSIPPNFFHRSIPSTCTSYDVPCGSKESSTLVFPLHVSRTSCMTGEIYWRVKRDTCPYYC